MYIPTITFLLVIGSAVHATPLIGQHLQPRDIGFTCELTNRGAQTPVLQPICVSAGDCPYVAFSSSSGLATGCATADQCCVRFRCTTSSGKSGVCKNSGGCGASSGCPKGSGCCPTSIVSDASEDDENGTVVAFNPDSIFDNQVTGEDGSGDPGEESTYQETSAIPSDYEYEAYGTDYDFTQDQYTYERNGLG